MNKYVNEIIVLIAACIGAFGILYGYATDNKFIEEASWWSNTAMVVIFTGSAILSVRSTIKKRNKTQKIEEE